MKYIVITGNPTPTEGFSFIGPFETAEIALEWAEETDIGKDYWIGEMVTPNWDHLEPSPELVTNSQIEELNNLLSIPSKDESAVFDWDSSLGEGRN